MSEEIPIVNTPIAADPQTPNTQAKAEASYQYQETKTVADVVDEANVIFEKYKKAVIQFKRENKIPEKFKATLDVNQHLAVNKERDRLLKKFQEDHKKFTQAYPLVLRLMCQKGEYDTTVFRKFLEHMSKHPYKTEDEYFTLYSEYAKMLHRHYNPRADVKELQFVQQTAKKALKEEKTEFEALAKKYEAEFDEREKKAMTMKRDFILERMISMTMRESVAEAKTVLAAVENAHGDDFVLVEDEEFVSDKTEPEDE
jgi:hypothetical protein